MLKVYKLKDKVVAFEYVDHDHVEYIDSEFDPNMVILDGKLVSVPSEALAAKASFDAGKVMVNVTSDGAVIHDHFVETIQYDEDRWDRFFDTVEEAKLYVESLSSN